MSYLSVKEILHALNEGSLTSTALTQAYLERIQQHDARLNSFITINDQALASAEKADERRNAGQGRALEGLPIGLKDLFCTQNLRTTCGSKILENFTSPYESTVSQKLLDAGALVLGKQNMDEFAMGSTNESSFYGPVTNPHDSKAVPGGSSGGSAAAVAAGLCAAAIGSDTGGSVRQPAAYCGITGMKPTYGRISRWGMVAYASSLDQAGTLTRTAEDAAYLLNTLAGPCQNDSTCSPESTPDFTAELEQPLTGLTIGIPKPFIAEGLSEAVSNSVQETSKVLESLGATVKEVDLDYSDLAIAAYYIIAPAEASSNLSRFDGVRYGYRCDAPQNLEDLYKRSRSEGFGMEVQRRIMIGTYVLSAGYFDAYYLQALKVRNLIKQAYDKALSGCDALLGPVAPDCAPDLGEQCNDPVKMYLSDIHTIGVNLAGLPAISVPAGMDGSRPVGIQFIGRQNDESRILNIAHQFQKITDWHQRRPAIEGGDV